MTRLLLPFDLSILGLRACATPNEMRQGRPFVEVTSTKLAKDVALCIAERRENSGYGGMPSVTFRPSETGYIVAVRNEWIGSTQLLVDIEEASAGSVLAPSRVQSSQNSGSLDSLDSTAKGVSFTQTAE